MESLFLLLDAPAVNVAALHRSEYSVFETLFLALHSGNEVLHALAVGEAVRRAGGLDHVQLAFSRRTPYLFFRRKGKGTYNAYLLSLHKGYWRVAAYPPLGEQVHQESFHRIIIVVTQRQFIAAQFHAGIIQRTPPHSGAKAAWVRLFSHVENYLTDLRGDYVVLHSDLPAIV